MTTPTDLDALVSNLAQLTGTTPAEMRAKLATMAPADLAAMIDRLPVKMRDGLAGLGTVGARIGSTVVLTEKQQAALALLNGPATHVLLAGGSRSSKTFTHCMFIAERALTYPSRHAILRFRFSHLHASIIEDTFPKVMGLCFPRAGWKLDRQLWLVRFENGSEIWFGGLDEKERVEKVLGQEHSTLFFNEASQIPLSSRMTAITRLAQKTPLSLKALYDCNPPSRRHWLHSFFIDKIDPNRHQPLPSPENYAALAMNPRDNLANLRPEYLAELEQLDERRRQRFLLGQWSDDDASALWTPEMLDRGRLIDRGPPDMQRVVVAVDPSGCSGPEDLRSDEVGIVVVGLGEDGRAYVMEDLSGRFGPDQWKTIVASAYDRHGADLVVAETNFGGSMVGAVLRTAIGAGGYPLNFREVTASRGKIARAEPIAALWSQNRVCIVGRLAELEHQLSAMTLAGYMGDRSPDRADAMIWGLTALFPSLARASREDQAGPDASGPHRGRMPRVILSPGAAYQLSHYQRAAARGRR